MRVLWRLLDVAERICLLVSAVALVGIMLLTTIDVVLRKLTDYSVPSLYELVQDYFMVALVFLSISYVYKEGGHVRVTLFQGVVPEILREPLRKLTDLLALVLFGLMTVMGWKAAESAWELQEVSSSILAYPIAPALFFVPLGCALTCLRIVQSLFSQVWETGDERSDSASR